MGDFIGLYSVFCVCFVNLTQPSPQRFKALQTKQLMGKKITYMQPKTKHLI